MYYCYSMDCMRARRDGKVCWDTAEAQQLVEHLQENNQPPESRYNVFSHKLYRMRGVDNEDCYYPTKYMGWKLEGKETTFLVEM